MSILILGVKVQHFKLVISDDASLTGNSFPIVGSHGLAGSKVDGHHCLSQLMYKAKAMAITTAVPCSFSASGIIRGYHVYQRIWTPHVGEKATKVREPGNEHDRSTSNAAMQSKYTTE